MEKRGQFYLMVSAIMVAVMVGFLTKQNTVIEEPFTDVSILKESMQVESERIMDYALYNGDYSVLDDFTKDYSEYLEGRGNIIYIINHSGGLDIYEYPEEGNKEKIDNYDYSDGNVVVPLNSVNYTFELNKREDFYFILTKEQEGERYVTTNEI